MSSETEPHTSEGGDASHAAPDGWTKNSDKKPPPHARYEVRRAETGPFVATPCYGMHTPWWVPITVDLYKPGAFVIGMDSADEWRPWKRADDAE